MKSKELQQVLGKFLKSEAAGNARVQVVLPNGEYYDITGMQLLEKKTPRSLLRETLSRVHGP
jgi:hypothetical protein